MTTLRKITCDDAVRALKMHGASTAAMLGACLETDSRAVATALRGAVKDGRITIRWKRNLAVYRFVRLTTARHPRQNTREKRMSGPLDMAIEVLDQQAQRARENQQIHTTEGKLEQAALDAQIFKSCLDAIERLKGSA